MSTERRLKGTIEKRGENKYRLTVSGGTDADGRRIRHRKTVTASSDREAEKLLLQYIAELEGNDYYEPEKMHFKTFAYKWLEEYVKPNLAVKTYVRYKELLEKRVIPALGNLTLDRIKPLHVVEFLNSLRQDGARLDGKPGSLSPSTIHHHYRMLSSLFATAAEWGMIKENIMARVKPPKVEKRKANCYTLEQAAAMLKALDEEPLKYKALVHLALVSGLRLGELMGLEWQDIDFEKGTLQVERTSQSLSEYGTFTKAPKTEDSRREISLPASTLQLLKEYRREWLEHRMKVGDLWQGSNRLWTTWDGRPMHTTTPSSWFPKFLRKHGLPHLNFHGLRHTNATFLIVQGVDIRTVSGRLGHAKTSTTLDIYTHTLRKADEIAAQVMDDLISRKIN